MAKILGSPDLQNDTMRCHLGIRLGLGKCKNGDFNDALSDLNRLSTLLDSVREDKCITGVKIETDAVQKLVLKGSSDISSDFWDLAKLCDAKTIANIANEISTACKTSTSCRPAEDDDSDFAGRIRKGQKPRAIVRKISEEAALDMLIESGERKLRIAITSIATPSKTSAVSNIIDKNWEAPNSMDDHVMILGLQLQLLKLAATLEQMNASPTVISEAATNWIICRRHELNPCIELSISPSFGSAITKVLHPSEWSIHWGNFSFLLRDSSPVQNAEFSKQKTSPPPRYFAFEKTSRII